MMMGQIPMVGVYGQVIQTLLTAFSGLDVAALSAPPAMGATGGPPPTGAPRGGQTKTPGVGVHNGTPAAIGAQGQSSNTGLANGGQG